MSGSNRRVIALGNLAGELKTSLEAAARAVGVELLLTREPARAFVELERDGALAVLVDMATLGAEQFCKRARGTERLRSVPVIGMSRHPNELGFARVFAWGADDLVPLGARLPLERRLEVLRDTPPPDTTGFGQAVVAEATTQRRALVGRVLAQAGYDVKFAVDRGAVELYASQSETRLVIISAALGDPRRIIEAAAKAGALPTWIITVEARSTQRLAASLAGLDRVAVTSTAGSPEDVLFLANELVFSKGARRREWRALYATPVAFRSQGSDGDEYGFSYDASPRGLYVRSLLPCPTEEVEVELRLPNRDERVRLSGKVAKKFAFGSGAIASAPPGFGVKLEGPADALARWTDACAELIAAASSSESMPPRARTPSQPVLQSPGLGGKEVALAVPPATVSIESVVAPLPIEVQSAVAAGSDVGELLAAVLDEQTLTEVGTRPVTMDSGGVREERPSEYGVSLEGLDPLATPVINEPLKAIPAVPAPGVPVRAPTPSPAAASFEPSPPSSRGAPPRPEPKPALAGTVVIDADAPVRTLHAADWDSDAKTTIRDSQPALAEAITLAPEPDPETAATAEPRPPVAEAKLKPPPPPERTPPAAVAGAKELARPFAATVAAPLPPPMRKRAASIPDQPAVSPPTPPAATPPAPPERAAASAPESSPLAPPAPPSSPQAESPRVGPPATARTVLHTPSVKQTLPMGLPRQETPKIDAPKVEPPAPKPAPRAPEPATSAEDSKPLTPLRVLLYALGGLAAVAVGGGAAVVLQHQRQAGESSTRPDIVERAAATTAETTPAAATAAPTVAKAAPATTATATTASTTTAMATTTAASAPSAVAPQASASAAPTSAASVAVAPTAVAPTAAAAPPAASTTHAPAAAPPPVTGPAIDLTKLPADRAALIVHSSVSTHVFVHGTDYGETNRPLVTSCGIRFVRLGRALGDFIEPGQSHVIKCGRLTELTIEPPQ